MEGIAITEEQPATVPAYAFDGRTGLYIGETVADLSPLEPGVYLVPRFATLAAPPDEIPAGSAPFWRGDVWQVEAVPEVDDDLDGAQDAPQGFAPVADKPGYFRRLLRALVGK